MGNAVKTIESLFLQKGSDAYFGEEVSQYEHAAQCFLLAQSVSDNVALHIAGFVHDIGHMLADDEEGFGRMDHDLLGAQWLTKNGFEELIVATALHHVNAKRYLCFVDSQYYNLLSEASKFTLSKQGGVMTEDQARGFEKQAYFKEIIQLRRWDEQAKMSEVDLPPLSFFLDIIETYLTNRI